MASLSAAKRIVIKIGSALLVDPTTGALRSDWLKSLAADVAFLFTKPMKFMTIALSREMVCIRPLSSTLKVRRSSARQTEKETAVLQSKFTPT